MVQISSAILGAASGIGLAFIVAISIIMYRYYLIKRRAKEWAELNCWDERHIDRRFNYKV